MAGEVLVAAIAAGAGVVGGLVSAVVGPFITHRLQGSSAVKEQRRALVQKWREMIHEIHVESDGDQNVKPMILTHPVYLGLEPHLEESVRKELRSKGIVIIQDNQGLAAPLQALAREITRIEKGWELV